MKFSQLEKTQKGKYTKLPNENFLNCQKNENANFLWGWGYR